MKNKKKKKKKKCDKKIKRLLSSRSFFVFPDRWCGLCELLLERVVLTLRILTKGREKF